MKTLFLSTILSALASFSINARAQGTIYFATHITGQVNAPVTVGTTGLGPGPDWTAQLFLVGAGDSLTPLLPATTFQASLNNPIQAKYVAPVTVEVPGTHAGDEVTLMMAAWLTSMSFEAAKYSFYFGTSARFTATLGGGVLPPSNLVNLEGFVTQIPEASISALLLGPGGILVFWRYIRRFGARIPCAEKIDRTTSTVAVTALVFGSVCSSLGQGTINFDTRIPPQVDAPISLENGQGPGPGWTAELFLVGNGGSLTPLFPATTFQSGVVNPIDARYVVPVTVTVPGIKPGENVFVEMAGWPTSLGSFEAAKAASEIGISVPTRITLGDATHPALLVGIQGYVTFPEPSTLALLLVGGSMIVLSGQKLKNLL